MMQIEKQPVAWIGVITGRSTYPSTLKLATAAFVFSFAAAALLLAIVLGEVFPALIDVIEDSGWGDLLVGGAYVTLSLWFALCAVLSILAVWRASRQASSTTRKWSGRLVTLLMAVVEFSAFGAILAFVVGTALHMI